MVIRGPKFKQSGVQKDTVPSTLKAPSPEAKVAPSSNLSSPRTPADVGVPVEILHPSSESFDQQEVLAGIGEIDYTHDVTTRGIMNQMLIPLETQTLYGEAFERAQLMDMDRSFGHLSGNFGRKQVGEETFWYFRTSEGARGRQEFYVGPDSEEVHALIQRYQRERQEHQEGRENLDRLAVMLAHGGCMTMDTPSARVVEALAAGGLFRLGGVLVGTHAFVTLGNMLGVRWKSGTKTQDLDFAAFRTLEVAVPQEPTDVLKALDALQMGFLPTPGLDPRTPSTSYSVRGKELRVDLLTTGSHRGNDGPIFLPRFNAAASPLRFMNYLLDGHTGALALGRSSATLVRVPQPARFGFHKILVADERPSSSAVKANKDITQATEILEHMLNAHPAEVAQAFDDLVAVGLANRVAKTSNRRMKNSQIVLDFINSRLV